MLLLLIQVIITESCKSVLYCFPFLYPCELRMSVTYLLILDLRYSFLWYYISPVSINIIFLIFYDYMLPHPRYNGLSYTTLGCRGRIPKYFSRVLITLELEKWIGSSFGNNKKVTGCFYIVSAICHLLINYFNNLGIFTWEKKKSEIYG